MLIELIIFIVGLIIIIKSADLFTTGASNIGLLFKVSRIIIGLTLVSFATTLPEHTVSALSSYQKLSGIAVGNALGSCLFNIGFILSLSAIFRPIKFEPKTIKNELLFLITAIILFFILSLDNLISRMDGVLLLLFLSFIYTFIIRREMKSKKDEPEKKDLNISLKKSIIIFLIGAIGVIISAKYLLIPSSVKIAEYFRVPKIIIGLTLVAIGTSLPEFVTAIVSAIKKINDLSSGNIIGANLLNTLSVTGISAIINPLEIDKKTFSITIPAIFIMNLLLFIFARTEYKLRRWEGLLLCVFYIGVSVYLSFFAYN